VTFVVRCASVSLAFFFLAYCALSVTVARGWRAVRRVAAGLPARHVADLLFVLRLFPLASAALVTLAFVLPSFLLLEPRRSAERIGEVPFVLSVACLLWLGFGVWRAGQAYARTEKTVAGWMEQSTAGPACERVPVFRIRPSVPALTVAGMWSPKMLLSEAAASVLGVRELHTALRHELAHVRRWDNLKKLIFRLCAFPGMLGLESAWGDAEEMAADDAAVTSVSDALDLASALIKLSRLAPLHPSAALTTALLNNSTASVNMRVARLVAWDETQAREGRPHIFSWYAKAAVVGTTLSLLITYGAALRDLHALTELLVRQ